MDTDEDVSHTSESDQGKSTADLTTLYNQIPVHCSCLLSGSSVDLNLKPDKKFTLMQARKLDQHTLTDKDLTCTCQVPNYILKNLMIVNYRAREFKVKSITEITNRSKSNVGSDESEDEDESNTKDSTSPKKEDKDVGINPIDGLLWVFHCSDIFLRRDLAIKLSACQLSVPFLLPDPAAPSANVTMLLSALKSITKSWQAVSNDNKSAQEVFATEYPFPLVSFIRIGKNTMSKSSLINKIMSDAIGEHNFFFHKNIKGGDVQRKLVDGLVELSWFQAGEGEEQTLQKEICFTNLRGDAKRFKKQLDVLLKISSVLCILLPSNCLDKQMLIILEEATKSEAKIILIFNEKRQEDTNKYFTELRRKSRGKLSLITSANKSNDYDFFQSIRENIQATIHTVKPIPLVDLVSCAGEYGIELDDDPFPVTLAQNLHNWLNMGTKEAKSLLKLQMHVPKFADLERKKHCIKRREKSKRDDMQRDVDEIYKDIETEKEAQKKSFSGFDEKILHFLNCIAVMDATERNLSLDETKHQLDKMSLQVLANLHDQYRVASEKIQETKTQEQSDARLSEEKHLKELEKSILGCSFGLEHIIREIAQLYQIPDINTIDYAGIAADMLLSGQPLELLDGDSCYIPLRWFDAVYRRLECKTNNAKIFVISVLGIQSSGKSTMLNTMFGLQFPVSAGRCTRGAFVSLIPVSDSLESKFNYVLVIDTEGLRGSGDPQLRQHDNELATFAIGLADVTIVNIKGENLNEIKEFLEIAVHAFLKMMLVKEKKSCKIVHQNVADTKAKDKLSVERSHLKKYLNEMTQIAALQENCEHEFKKFDDIISFNENKDVFYIPSLLQGSPPMAPVNPNYGRAIQRLKENVIQLMCQEDKPQLSLSHFRKRVTNLWEAMLKENFIFTFRNTIEVRAYTSLDRKFFEESVNLMVVGMAELERKIQVALGRCTTTDKRKGKWKESQEKIKNKAEELKEKMEKAMNHFFETNEDKATLEQWKANVMQKIEELEDNQRKAVLSNCYATYKHLQNRQDVEEMKQKYEKKLLQKARKFIVTSPHNAKDPAKFKEAFEQEWKQWIAEVPPCQETKKDINAEMVDVLCETNRELKSLMTEKLKEKKIWILNFKESAPVIHIDKLNISYSSRLYNYFVSVGQDPVSLAEKIACKAVQNGVNHAYKKSQSNVRYVRGDLTQMYLSVIKFIEQETDKCRFKFRKILKRDILLYTFANAYGIFDEMETRYIQERDIKDDLERNLRPRLETFFLNLCSQMGKDVLAATSIVEVLRNPMESELKRSMGPAVTGELLTRTIYQSKATFHASVLIQLGEVGKFELYIPYFKDPITFLRNKLMESIENHCLNQDPTSINLLLTREAKKIENNVLVAISNASESTKTESESLNFWIQKFVESCSTLEVKKEMFAIAADLTDQDQIDVDVFQDKVLVDVKKFVESLIKRGVNQATIRAWNPSPHEYLFTSMFGCQSCCPFCKTLCDHTVKNHVGSHSTRIHRPLGLTGYKNTKTKILVDNICTTNVASEKSFINMDTSEESHLYKDYQSVNEYYKSWSIPPDPSFEASTYWQWFIATFSNELAEHYEAKQPDIPSAWKKHKFSEVKEQLRREYNMS